MEYALFFHLLRKHVLIYMKLSQNSDDMLNENWSFLQLVLMFNGWTVE